MLNTAMGTNIIEIGSNGIPVFRIEGQIADRMKAEAHIAEMVDDMGFESRAIENLF